jgi:hypothetical protein
MFLRIVFCGIGSKYKNTFLEITEPWWLRGLIEA